jgi:hypothetical protein
MSFWSKDRGFVVFSSEIFRESSNTELIEDLEDIIEIREISGRLTSTYEDYRLLSNIPNNFNDKSVHEISAIDNQNYNEEFYISYGTRIVIEISEPRNGRDDSKIFPIIPDKLKTQIDKLSDALKLLESLRSCQITYEVEGMSLLSESTEISLVTNIKIEILKNKKVKVKDTYLNLQKSWSNLTAKSGLKHIEGIYKRRGVIDPPIDINHSEVDDPSLDKITVGWFISYIGEEEIIPIASINKSTGDVIFYKKEFEQTIKDYLEDQSRP